LADIVRGLRAPDGRVRGPFRADAATGTIETVRDEGTLAGLRKGDRILSLGGQAYGGRKTMAEALEAARPGDALAVEVERAGGTTETHAVRLARDPERGRAGHVIGVAVGIVLPVVSLALGFSVAFLRPYDGRALLLLLMMMSFAQVPGPEIADEATWGPGWRVAGTLYDQVMAGTWPIWMMLFGIAFPERLALDRRRPWLKWLVVGPIALSALALALAAAGVIEGVPAAAPLVAFNRALGPLPLILSMAAVGSFFTSLGFKG